MFSVTRYCVQGFNRTAAGLVPSEGYRFLSEGEARDRARAVWRRSAGVAVYKVRSEPGWTTDAFSTLVAVYGVVPVPFGGD